jgi:hypothetical protein
LVHNEQRIPRPADVQWSGPRLRGPGGKVYSLRADRGGLWVGSAGYGTRGLLRVDSKHRVRALAAPPRPGLARRRSLPTRAAISGSPPHRGGTSNLARRTPDGRVTTYPLPSSDSINNLAAARDGSGVVNEQPPGRHRSSRAGQRRPGRLSGRHRQLSRPAGAEAGRWVIAPSRGLD